MQKVFWALLLALYSIGAPSQTTFYYCQKDGRQIISGLPCAEQGARESKRVDESDMPPLNTSQGLTAEERQQAAQNWEKRKAEEKQEEEKEQQRQKAEETAKLEAQEKERRCNELYQRRRSIMDRQKIHDSSTLRGLRVRVNIELQEAKCE